MKGIDLVLPPSGDLARIDLELRRSVELVVRALAPKILSQARTTFAGEIGGNASEKLARPRCGNHRCRARPSPGKRDNRVAVLGEQNGAIHLTSEEPQEGCKQRSEKSALHPALPNDQNHASSHSMPTYSMLIAS